MWQGEGEGVIKQTINVKAEGRRDLCFEKLHAIPGIKISLPPGAFYLFPDVSAYFGKQYQGQIIHNSQDLCMFLLNQVYLVTVAGSAFGNDNCIRLSYATSEENLNKAMDRIKEGLSLLS